MTFGIQTFDASGTLLWDSSAVAGGVLADVQVIAPGMTATYSYPGFAGFECKAIAAACLRDQGLSVSTAAGYPVVTVASRPFERTVLVMVF